MRRINSKYEKFKFETGGRREWGWNFEYSLLRVSNFPSISDFELSSFRI
jgi:hypothetical protein